ncbi:hypothetical protein [Streptomyces phaeoluteigriseus]
MHRRRATVLEEALEITPSRELPYGSASYGVEPAGSTGFPTD